MQSVEMVLAAFHQSKGPKNTFTLIRTTEMSESANKRLIALKWEHTAHVVLHHDVVMREVGAEVEQVGVVHYLLEAAVDLVIQVIVVSLQAVQFWVVLCRRVRHQQMAGHDVVGELPVDFLHLVLAPGHAEVSKVDHHYHLLQLLIAGLLKD